MTEDKEGLVVVIFVLTTALFVADEPSRRGDDWYSSSVAPIRTLVQSWCEVKGTSTNGMWSDSAWGGDRNLYFNATASVDGRAATVRSSPTQGEENGPAPSNVTIGDGFTESPSVLVTVHLGCNPTTVAVVGIGVMVAIPRDVLADLSGEMAACELSVRNDLSWPPPSFLLVEWEREGGCGRPEVSLGFVSETESLLACFKPT